MVYFFVLQATFCIAYDLTVIPLVPKSEAQHPVFTHSFGILESTAYFSVCLSGCLLRVRALRPGCRLFPENSQNLQVEETT